VLHLRRSAGLPIRCAGFCRRLTARHGKPKEGTLSPPSETTATTPSDSAPERPTLKTIAAATGLAIATVSRALKDAPDIGEETKRRVRETAATLGYRPNRAGVRLRTGKTNVIALVLSAETEMMNHTAQLIYSIAAALRGSAYHLVVMPFFAEEDPMAPIRYLVETGSADGVVFNQTIPDDPRARYMFERGFPFATHGRTSSEIAHPYFDYDNEAYADIAVRELVRRGRKRLLLIAPPREHNYSRHMVAGFTAACAEQGVSGEIMQGVTSDSGSDRIEHAVAVLLNRPDRPDGVITASPTAAIGCVNGAERIGLHVGVEFDIVAKEAVRFLQNFRREIIVMHEDVGRAGQFIAHAVMAAIERQAPEQGQCLERPATILNEGQST
jgi:LacI family transcriptional regulator